MGLFSTSKIKALSTGKIPRYLAYALGEIILVVVGILIAVSINNRNQRVASEEKLDDILEVYRQDLEVDTTYIGKLEEYFVEREKTYTLIFNPDSITRVHPSVALTLLLTKAPINLQSKGVKQLEQYASSSNDIQKDSILFTSIVLHNAAHEQLEGLKDNIDTEIKDNLNYYKTTQPWFSKIGNSIPDPALTDYVHNSWDFKNRIAMQHLLVYTNLVPFLKAYKASASKQLESLEKIKSNKN